MNKPFTQDFHLLSALIQHLAAHEVWKSRTPRNIADSLGLEKDDVGRVLNSYPAFFRRSSNLSKQGEPLYTVHLRYARRKKDPSKENQRVSPPLDSSEITLMLSLVTQMIAVEAQDERLREEVKQNNLKIWLAMSIAGVSSITAILTALLKG